MNSFVHCYNHRLVVSMALVPSHRLERHPLYQPHGPTKRPLPQVQRDRHRNRYHHRHRLPSRVPITHRPRHHAPSIHHRYQSILHDTEHIDRSRAARRSSTLARTNSIRSAFDYLLPKCCSRARPSRLGYGVAISTLRSVPSICTDQSINQCGTYHRPISFIHSPIHTDVIRSMSTGSILSVSELLLLPYTRRRATISYRTISITLSQSHKRTR